AESDPRRTGLHPADDLLLLPDCPARKRRRSHEGGEHHSYGRGRLYHGRNSRRGGRDRDKRGASPAVTRKPSQSGGRASPRARSGSGTGSGQSRERGETRSERLAVTGADRAGKGAERKTLGAGFPGASPAPTRGEPGTENGGGGETRPGARQARGDAWRQGSGF